MSGHLKQARGGWATPTRRVFVWVYVIAVLFGCPQKSHGQGYEKDYARGIDWYSQDAEQGDAISQYFHGKRYQGGGNGFRDDVEAVKWIRKSAEQGFYPAEEELSKLYAAGTGVMKSYARSLEWGYWYSLHRVQNFKVSKKDWAKPTYVSDEQLAAWLAAVLSRKDFKRFYSERRLVKWGASLRVLIVDGEGKDIDLTSFPGDEIQESLAVLAEVTGISISTTTQKKHDNNVSIILRDSYDHEKEPQDKAEKKKYYIRREAQRRVGMLYGVPDLKEQTRIFSNFLQISDGDRSGGQSIETFSGDDSEYWNVFRRGYEIKACGLEIVYYSSGSNIKNMIKNFMLECFSKIPENFLFAALPLLYNKDIKPGMKPEAAAPIFLREIQKLKVKEGIL